VASTISTGRDEVADQLATVVLRHKDSWYADFTVADDHVVAFG
jgi:hypothetical protein